ncbi:ClpXP protease specificity-enhancing factor SspB [Amylibacter sp.]|nr:ClpXP protease specificity-enhancing factor SspB [Amylibacter sp.]
MTDTINYAQMMQKAMQGLMIDVLKKISKNGLPGNHHYFISFDTKFEGVVVADWIKERYPEEMTIVIQHWFDNLEVNADNFSITLNFGDNPENLTIPWNSISTFVDPSVEFGLRFEDEANEDIDAVEEIPESKMVIIEDDDENNVAEIVSLDSFRKK